MPKPISGTTLIKIEDVVVGERSRTDLGDLLSLATSIKQNGLINAIVVDKGLNLVAGYRRLEACKRLSWTYIEAHFYEELTPFERKKLELEENIIHKKAVSWQEEITLKQQLHNLYLEEHAEENLLRKKHGEKAWGQKQTAEVLGIATSSLSEDLRLAKAIESFPELKGVATKRDAIRKMYRLREFALLQELSRRKGTDTEEEEDVVLKLGDCLEILPNVKDESIDLIITDPPWGIGLEDLSGAGALDYKMFTDIHEIGLQLYEKSIPHLYRVLKQGGHLYIFFDIASHMQIFDMLSAANFDVRPVPIVWIKDKPGYTDWEFKPMPQYESCFFATKHTKDQTPRRLTEATSDVMMYQRSAEKKLHPTEKPIELMKRFITLSSSPGEIVLDPFAGSGSMLCAALLTGRRAIGIEKDKDYFELAKGRIRTMKMQIIMSEDEEEKEGGEVKPNGQT